MSQTRRLAPILAADVAGYSRLIRADELEIVAEIPSVLKVEPAEPCVMSEGEITYPAVICQGFPIKGR